MTDISNIRLRLVQSVADVHDLLAWLGERREFLSVDIETTGLNAGCDYIRLAQFGDTERGFALDYRDWRGVVKEVLGRYDRPIVAHNLLFETKMFKADGIIIPQKLAHCSMVMAHLNDPASAIGLKPVAARLIDKRARIGENLLKEAMARGGWNWATIPTDVPAYWQYGTLDTCLSAILAEKLYPEIRKQPYELELAVIHVLREAELAGLLVDEDYRRATAAKLAAEIEVLRPQIPVENPGSDSQVVKYLQSVGAPLTVRTEHGNLSVDKDVLKYLSSRGFPVAGVLREWRQKTRFLHNYIEKFGEVGEGGLAVNGVLRASTKPVAARTGRMSITDPPLQTLPRGRVVRDAIVARPGQCFVMADFAGMELRVLASFAQEAEMLAAFARGEDLHDMTATKLYTSAFTKPQRTLCKNGAFANIYGAGVEKFAVTADVDIDVARSFREQYDAMFPGIKVFQESVVRDVIQAAGGKRKGYGHVTLIDGRWLPVEAEKAYKGVNFRIQGSCAVALKERIVALDHAGLGEFFRLPVHDELLFECPHEAARDVIEVVQEVMPDRRNFPGVTLEIDVDCVERWGEHYEADFPSYIDTPRAAWREGLPRKEEGEE